MERVIHRHEMVAVAIEICTDNETNESIRRSRSAALGEWSSNVAIAELTARKITTKRVRARCRGLGWSVLAMHCFGLNAISGATLPQTMLVWNGSHLL